MVQIQAHPPHGFIRSPTSFQWSPKTSCRSSLRTLRTVGCSIPLCSIKAKSWTVAVGIWRARSQSVEPKFQDYVGDDPLGYVVSRNLHRRHLSESQRAMVAASLADLKRGANQHSEGLPIGRAAAMLNVRRKIGCPRQGGSASRVPELVSAVEGGELAVSAAADISGMPESEQRETVASGSRAGRPMSTPRRGSTKRKTTQAARNSTCRARRDMAPAAEAERLKAELAAANETPAPLEQELENARVVASRTPCGADASVKTPAGDDEIPPFLDRRPLSR